MQTPASDSHRGSAEPAPGGSAAVAALTVSLFLLACAYAAFSGYMHSNDDAYAWIGIFGGAGCLTSAGIGLCLAASGLRRGYSRTFLAICAVTLTLLFAVLLFAVAGR